MADGPRVETLSFAARDDGFEGYHALYSVGTDVDRTDHPFQAQVRVRRFQRMILYERTLGGLLHRRDARRVRWDGFDHFALHLVRGGELVGGPPGAEHRLQPGAVMLVDTARPHWTRTDRAELISVQLAREVVAGAIGDVDALHGAVLPEAAAGLLADFLGSLARRADSLPPGATERVAATAAELLAIGLSAFGPASAAAQVSGEAVQPLLRLRAEDYIDAHLADPGLDAAGLAAGIGASRSALYRIFGADGVARVIRQRRLERLRDALRRPGDDRPVSVLAFACGLTSESHASRAFSSTFGMPPGQYRAAMRRIRREPAPEGSAGAVIAHWVNDLY